MMVFIGCRTWELTTTHASPNPSIRRLLWMALDELKVENPWMLISDFNCTLRDEERNISGGTSSSFQGWVARRGLIDLGWVGNAFTWNYGKSVETLRAACLDRDLCDDMWRSLFPNACIKNLGIRGPTTVLYFYNWRI